MQRAAAELSGDEMEKYAGTSRVVQLGFGTSAMFGQALAYEQQKGEEAIAATYERYGRLIQEQEAAMLEAPDDAARQAIQSRIEALTRRNNDYVITQVTGGNITLDCTNNEMSTDVGSLILSTRETALLTFFLQHLNSDLAENELREVLDTEDKMAVRLYTTYLKNKLRQIFRFLSCLFLI